MKVSIDEIETKGLRCPDSRIIFKNRTSGGVINLLQMPNGTGKTTIVKLISASLNGDIAKWTPKEVKAFKIKTGESINGEFRITLSLETNSIKKLTFLTRFNFADGVTDIYTTRGDIGEEQGWLPPSELKQFFSEGCVDVFCFQGDKTKDIIDESKNDAEITIKAFFGFNQIDKFLEDIKKYHRDTIETGTPITKENIKAKELQAKSWEVRAITLKEDYDEKFLEKKVVDKNVETLFKSQRRIIEALDGSSEQELLDSKYTSANNEVINKSNDSWNDLKNPLLISSDLLTRLYVFRDSLEKMKLPGGSRSFFEELIREDDGCICGEELTDSRIKNIKNQIEQYLGDDEASVVNSIKTEISDSYENLKNSNSLKDDFKALDQALENRDEAFKAKEDYLKKMKELATPENKQIFEEYEKIVEQRLKLENILKQRLKDYVVETSQLNNPDGCKSYIAAENVAEKLYNEIGTISDKQGISESYKILKKVINSAKHNSLKEIKVKLADKTNEKIVESLPSGSEIEVLNIEEHVKLGWNGTSQSEGSGAQNIIIAYSFARSVLEEANIEFPLIVDHPFTQIDRKNRINLGKKLGSLMHQFIGFLIDTERAGFLEGIEDQTDVCYISMFSSQLEGNKSFIDKIEALPSSEFLKTDNGYVTYNKDFFIENEMGDH